MVFRIDHILHSTQHNLSIVGSVSRQSNSGRLHRESKCDSHIHISYRIRAEIDRIRMEKRKARWLRII